MIRIPIVELAAVVGGRLEWPPHQEPPAGQGLHEPAITAVATDTRTLDEESATAFVALRGDRHDGHTFVAEAIRHGVAVVVLDRRGRPRLGRSLDQAATVFIEVDDTTLALQQLARHVRNVVDPHAIAVTGSVGKTTVKDLTAASMSTTFATHASAASFNNQFGVPLTLLGMTTTVEALVAEIGARHPGDIASMAGIVQPDVAVVTAVEPVHLEPFGSIEAIAATKQELVDSLGLDGTAVLNVDNPWVRRMVSVAPAAIRVSVDMPADVTAEEVTFDADGHACCKVRTPWGSTSLRLPLPGKHQLINGLLAIAASATSGVPVADAAHAVGGATVSRWRGQVHKQARRTIIDDAYNANPASMRAALDTLSLIARGRPTIAVLGEMAEIGPTSSTEHVALGQYCASKSISAVVSVGARAAGIADGAREAGIDDAIMCDDVPDAVDWVQTYGGDNPVILVKGSRVAGLDALVARLIATDADRRVQGPAA